jgi:hypothetical protein
MPDHSPAGIIRNRWFVALLGAAVIVLLLAGALAAWLVSRGDSDDSGLANLKQELRATPAESMSADESAGVLYTYEGQRLARDLHSVLGELWQAPIFEDAESDSDLAVQAAALLLPRAGVTPPPQHPGSYTDPQLSELYVELTSEGSASMVSALEASATLEELNIIDIQTQLSKTDKADLQLVYRHLIEAGGHELWSFTRGIERFGGQPYQPRYLTPEGYADILATAGNPEADSILLQGRQRRCGKELVEKVSRHRPTGTTEAEALRTRYCSTDVDILDAPFSLTTLTGAEVQISAYKTTALQFPAGADSNSPTFWYDGSIRVINSDPFGSNISIGPSLDQLEQTLPVQLPVPERPGTVWMESVWLEPDSGVLYGWYHFEPHDLDCYPLTAPIIGAALSYDGGETWEDQGFVIENPYPPDCSFDNEYFVGGSGDVTVVPSQDGEYFYFLFSNYIGPLDEVGVAVARSAFADRGQPGTVWKYFDGAWDEPGIDGQSSAIFPSPTGWSGPDFEAFWGPSVHWNSYLGRYVMLLNRADSRYWRQEGIYIAFSPDLEHWTEPEKIMDSNDWYPQVAGLSADGTDSFAGRFVRVFVGGLSSYVLEFARPDAEATPPATPPQ